MKVEVIPAGKLVREQISAWADLQSADGNLDSPFFRPEFTQAIAHVRDDVEVALLTEGDVAVGFLPFQRRKGHVGRPVGGPMSDFHGLILCPGHTIDARELVRRCGLSAWHFEHLVAGQEVFQPHGWSGHDAPYIDTSRGFDAYWAQRRHAGGDTVRKTFQKLRKLEREVGPVRFETATQDKQVLESLMAWKAEQCCRSCVFDFFSRPWTNRLFQNLLAGGSDQFCGMMSALYVRDELQAALYSLRASGVLHVWVTTYGPTFAQYSPGYQLLLHLIQAAPAMGITRIDLGPGSERFKRSFMSGGTPLAQGSVDTRFSRRRLRQLWRSAYDLIRQSPLRRSAVAPWRVIKRMHDRFEYR